MANSNVIDRARQADPEAIAALMNHSLQSKGITASVEREGDRLEVQLESDAETNPSILTTFVSNGLKNLNITSIRTAKIQGTKQGSVIWEDIISVGQPSAVPAPSEPTQPATQAAPPLAQAPPPPPSRAVPTVPVVPAVPAVPTAVDSSASTPDADAEGNLSAASGDGPSSGAQDRSPETSPVTGAMPSEDTTLRGIETFGNFDKSPEDLDEPDPPIPAGASALAPSAVLSSPEVLVEALPSVPDDLLEEQARVAEDLDPPRFVPAVGDFDADDFDAEDVGDWTDADAGTVDNAPEQTSQEAESSRGPSRVLFTLVLLLLAAIVGGLLGYAVWSYLTGTSPLEEFSPREQQAPTEPIEEEPAEEELIEEEPPAQEPAAVEQTVPPDSQAPAPQAPAAQPPGNQQQAPATPEAAPQPPPAEPVQPAPPPADSPANTVN